MTVLAVFVFHFKQPRDQLFPSGTLLRFLSLSDLFDFLRNKP
jgi:hypothetical protein